MEGESHTCQCCGNTFTGNYCNQCGQRVISRFNLKYLWSLLSDDILEIDRGFWHTAKDLTLHPGKMISNYLGGNTKKYFSPIKYLFILAALIYSLLTIVEAFESRKNNNPFEYSTWKERVFGNNIAPFSSQSWGEIVTAFPLIMKDYLGFYFLTILPFAAFAGKFVFKKLNFTEVLLTWIYLWSHIMYLLIIYSLLISWTALITTDGSMIIFFSFLGVFFVFMFYYFTSAFRYLTSGKWLTTFIKVIFTMYAGFFTAFGLTWVILGIVKIANQ